MAKKRSVNRVSDSRRQGEQQYLSLLNDSFGRITANRTAMEQLIEMYDQIDSVQSWNAVYQEIDKQSYKQERKLKLTTKIAHSCENAERNRYRNVLAYDTSRVVLKRSNCEKSDYINASPLTVPSAKRNYILTQGPLSTTSEDFWQMVWEQNSVLIIMLNKIVEKGLPKCHNYYPTVDCPSREFDSFNVFLKEEQNFDNYVIRNLELVRKNVDGTLGGDNASYIRSRIIKHFQFMSWPDFGVPQSTSVFIEFLQKVRETGLLSEKGPTVVHCSAGIGRSGTFVVADSVLSMHTVVHASTLESFSIPAVVDKPSSKEPQLKNVKTINKVEENVEKIDVADVVVEMRKSRMGLIQTPQQLQFCWKTIADALRQGYVIKGMKSDGDMRTSDRKIGRDLLAVPNNHINGEADEIPHLERSQANQMTVDLHAKSTSGDLSSLRKRASSDSTEAEKEAKQARRKERVGEMRARLLKCEDARKKWHHITFGGIGIGYACAVTAVAFAVYCIYRLTS